MLSVTIFYMNQKDIGLGVEVDVGAGVVVSVGVGVCVDGVGVFVGVA